MIPVYIHRKDDKMWIALSTTYKTINSFNLYLESDVSGQMGQLDISEKYVQRLSRPTSPCKWYETESGYNECIQKTITDTLKQNLTCFYAGTFISKFLLKTDQLSLKCGDLLILING